MGFLRKYIATTLVTLLLLLSTFLSVHTMTDLVAETRGSSVSTRRVLEELVVGEGDQVVYVKQVVGVPGANITSNITLLPG